MQDDYRFDIFSNYKSDEELPYLNYLLLKIIEQTLLTFKKNNPNIRQDCSLNAIEDNTLNRLLLFLNANRNMESEQLYNEILNFIVTPHEPHKERHKVVFSFLQELFCKLRPELQRFQAPPDFTVHHINHDLAMIFIDNLFRVYLMNRIIEKFIAQQRSAWWEQPFGDSKLDAKANIILRLIRSIIEYRETEYKIHGNYTQYYHYILGFADLASEKDAEIEASQSSYLQKAWEYFSVFKEKFSPKNTPKKSKFSLALREVREKLDKTYQKESELMASSVHSI